MSHAANMNEVFQAMAKATQAAKRALQEATTEEEKVKAQTVLDAVRSVGPVIFQNC